jgi:hypothetical protein
MSTGARSRTYDTSSTLIWGLTRTQLLEVVLECYHVGRIVQSGYTKMANQGPGVLLKPRNQELLSDHAIV